MDDLHRRVVLIHSPVAQIDDHLFRGFAGVLQQYRGLLQLLIEHMPVVGVAGEGACAHHQTALVRDGNAGLNAELVGLPGFPLADALDFRGVQGVELVLVFSLLGTDALGPFQQGGQAGDRGRGFGGGRYQLALRLA